MLLKPHTAASAGETGLVEAGEEKNNASANKSASKLPLGQIGCYFFLQEPAAIQRKLAVNKNPMEKEQVVGGKSPPTRGDCVDAGLDTSHNTCTT